MVVIWGLDLREMHWSKFKSSYMFKNRDYHLRRTKFALYQGAMIFCVVSESLGTAVLSDYLDQQKLIKALNHNATEYNNDYVGMDSYNIFAGIYVAFIFGAAFFFDLFWPERREIDGVRLAWRITSVLACVFMLADVITKTVIVVTHSAYVEGVNFREAARLAMQAGKETLVYRHNPRAIASLVFAWLGFVFVIASTIVMYMSLSYIEKNGPFSRHATSKQQAAEAQTGMQKSSDKPQNDAAGSPSSEEPSELGKDIEKKASDTTQPPTRPQAERSYTGT